MYPSGYSGLNFGMPSVFTQDVVAEVTQVPIPDSPKVSVSQLGTVNELARDLKIDR